MKNIFLAFIALNIMQSIFSASGSSSSSFVQLISNPHLRIVLSLNSHKKQFGPGDFAASLHVQKVYADTTNAMAEALCKTPDFLTYALSCALESKAVLKPKQKLYIYLLDQENKKEPFKISKFFKVTLESSQLRQAEAFLQEEHAVKESGKFWPLKDIKMFLPNIEILIGCGLFVKAEIPTDKTLSLAERQKLQAPPVYEPTKAFLAIPPPPPYKP